MKVLIVETDARGGLIHFTYQLAESLSAAGTETTIVTGQDYELDDLPHRATVQKILHFWPQFDPPAGSALSRRVRALWRPLRRGWRALVLLREWERLTRHIEAEAPDIAVFSIIRFPFQAYFLRRLQRSGIRLAQICHEFAARERDTAWLRSIHMRLSSKVYACFSTIFFLSEDTRRAFLEVFDFPKSRTFVLPHGPALVLPPASGVDVAARYSVRPDARMVLMFGGLRPSKGVPDLIDAFAKPVTPSDVRLVIAGYPSRGFDTDAVEAQALRAGVADRIAFDYRYLPMDELNALVGRADVVVFPYRNATASGALALAQSLARPVVATAVGGLAEVVEDGISGRLVPPSDPDALAVAIATLLDDPQEACRMGERGRADLDGHSWAVVARRMLDVLEREEDAESGAAEAVQECRLIAARRADS